MVNAQAALYSVRWYFENEEFYRYVPKESPPSIVFPVSGITVDVSILFQFQIFVFFFFQFIRFALSVALAEVEWNEHFLIFNSSFHLLISSFVRSFAGSRESFNIEYFCKFNEITYLLVNLHRCCNHIFLLDFPHFFSFFLSESVKMRNY